MPSALACPEGHQFCGQGSGPLAYHGGEVQHSPTLHVIFWGTPWREKYGPEQAIAELEHFYASVSGSAYQGILTQYDDHTGRISSSISVDYYFDDLKPAEEVNGAAITNEAAAAIQAEKWETGPNAQFVVMVAGTYEKEFAEHEGQVVFCGYHGVLGKSTSVPEESSYTFVPYQGEGRFSSLGCGGPETEEDIHYTVKVASHEYAESATDPYVSGAPGPEGTYGAWWEANEPYSEIGDICNEPEGYIAGLGYVNALWDNHLGSCSLSDASPPAASIPPVATTTEWSSDTYYGATLNGTVEPSGSEGKYYFEYGETFAYGKNTPETAVGAGFGTVPIATAVEGLKPATVYHFRLVASDAAGSVHGEDLIFKTLPAPSPPEATTNSATEVTLTGARLLGRANPKGLETTYHFEYGPTTSYGTSVPVPSASIGSGRHGLEAIQTIGGLHESTLYHYRLVAANSLGTTYGADNTLTTHTAAAPGITTGTPTSVKKASVQLNGTVNPKGSAVSACRFEYGTTLSYGSSVSCESLPGSGEVAVPVSAAATGLHEKTTYHFRLVATSSAGTSYGGDHTVTTPPEPPTVETIEGSGFGASSVKLHANVNPEGLNVSTCTFEYGTTEAYGSSVSCGSLPGSGETPVYVSASLSGLHETTAYYYRISATNSLGTTKGANKIVKTTAISQCSGENITVAGSTAQKLVQYGLLTNQFNVSSSRTACNDEQGSGGVPLASFNGLGSSRTGMEEWGVNGKSFNGGGSRAIIATDEPPNAEEIAEIQSHSKQPAEKTLQTIPVAQMAVAVAVHLPSGCSATSVSNPGRLVLDNVTLEKIWRGIITRWNEITEDGDALTGSGCKAGSAITRVVSRESGTTSIFKKYLDLIYSGSVLSGRSWKQISEGAAGGEWPGNTVISSDIWGGDETAVKLISETASSIGYTDLAAAQRNAHFVPPTGGANTARFWVPIQNNGAEWEVEGEEETYADPSTNGDAAEAAKANCSSTQYTNGESPFPPASTTALWNEVTTKTTEIGYPICGLTYDLSFTKYSQYFGTSSQEAQTASDYLLFELASNGGQEYINNKLDYMALPTSLQTEGREGAEKVKY